MSICVVAVKLFQIATPTVFLRFSRSLAHMIYVPMQKTGTDFQNLDFWQIFNSMPTECIDNRIFEDDGLKNPEKQSVCRL